MIHVGVDLHQRFCYCTAVKASGEVIAQRSVVNEAESLRRFVRSLPQPAQVVVEACGFWPAFKKAIEKDVERVVMVHPQRVKAIAAARLKNDRVDSATLAHLSRCDLLPQAWMADEATRQLRLQVRLRVTLGRERSRLKNLLQAVPRVRESAGKRSYGSITRAGSETLRWILLQVAQVAVRHAPAARRFYERLKKKKRPQVAKVALARKLLCAVWALLRQGVCYDDQVFAA